MNKNFVIVLVALSDAVISVSTQAGTVKKNDPVAVVYYRCKPDISKSKCVAQGGLYYVHNAVAGENLPRTDGEATIYHVATWPTPDPVHFCNAKDAYEATKQDQPGSCAGSKAAGGAGETWRAWVLVKDPIRPYQGGQPIAWRNTNTQPADEPHNGVFLAFTPDGGQRTTNFTNGGKGQLEYGHSMNPNNKQDGRIAKHPTEFEFNKGKDPEGSGSGVIEIKKIFVK